MLQNPGEAPYRIYQNGHRYRTVNHAQELSILFMESGVQVCLTAPHTANLWDLALARWGYGDALKPVSNATLAALDNQITYQRESESPTEWYMNGLFGLEHVLTLMKSPSNKTSDESLILEFSFFEDGTRQITADGQSVLWSRMDDAPALVYRHLYATDMIERDLPLQVEVVEAKDSLMRYMRLVIDDARAVYPIHIAFLIQQADLTESDNAADNALSVRGAVTSERVAVGVPV